MDARLDAKLCSELVERVSGSRHFRKSARTQELLLYLTTRALQNPGGDIREQEIGTALFGRRPDYDTSADTIVRVNVYELRKRLDAYFSDEGLADPAFIEIPKGSYCPVFTLRKSAPSVEPVLAPSLESLQRKPLSRYLFPVLAVLLAGGCVALTLWNMQLREQLAGPKGGPSLQRLWSRMFQEGRSTEVVVADSVYAFMQDAFRKPVPLAEYSSSGKLPPSLEAVVPSEARPAFAYLMSQRYTSLADIHTLQRLFLLSGSDVGRLNIHFARDFSAESLKSSNVVLIGSKKSNPWAGLFDANLDFNFENDPGSGAVVILNRRPKPGEQSNYVTTVRPSTPGSYGLVAFIPNLAYTGNVLIVAGAGVASTEAAGELVTNEHLFEQLTRTMGVSPGKPLPHFEVLLKTTVMGATMQPPQVVCWHTRSN